MMTETRKKRAVELYEQRPTNRAVADAIGVDEKTIRDERKRDPEFDAALVAADDRHANRLGLMAKRCVEIAMEDYIARKPVARGAVAQKTGTAMQVFDSPEFPKDAVLKAFNRADQRWSKPVEQVEISGTLTFEERIAGVIARRKQEHGGKQA